MNAKTFLPVSTKTFSFFAALLSLCSLPAMAQNPDTASLHTQQAIAKLTRYEVKQAHLEQFRKALSDYVLHSISSENNIMAEAYYEGDIPSVLWLIERWGNKNEWKQFSNTENTLVKPARHIYVKDLEPISKQQWRRASNVADSQLTIMLFVDAKPGTQKTFMDVYHVAMPQFRREPGVVTYQLSQLEEDETQFVTYEKFRSNAAFQYHLNFPPVKPVVDYLNASIKKQPFQSGLHTLIEFAPLTRE